MQADRSVARRMDELAQRAARSGIAQVAWFLSPAEQAQADISARQADVALFEEGGTPDAERRVVAFADADWEPEWPIVCLRVSWHAKAQPPGHRDLLGAILGLGIGREKVGDIFIREGDAFVFALREMGSYMAASLDSAGHTPVKVELLEQWPSLAGSGGEEMRATVASLRLDAVLGAAWKLSRGRAAELVSQGRVQVNHQPELRPDRQIIEGSMLSVRGMGRAKLQSVTGTTKKGRIGIVLLRY